MRVLTAILALTASMAAGENALTYMGNWEIAEIRNDPFSPGAFRASAGINPKSDERRNWEFTMIAQCDIPAHSRVGNYKIMETINRLKHRYPDEMATLAEGRAWLTPEGLSEGAPEALQKAVSLVAENWPSGWAKALAAIAGADIEIWTYFYAEFTNLTDENLGEFPLDVAFGGPEHEGDVRTLQAINLPGDKYWHIEGHDQKWLTFRINSSDKMFIRWNQYRAGILIAEFDLNDGRAALAEIRRRCALHRTL